MCIRATEIIDDASVTNPTFAMHPWMKFTLHMLLMIMLKIMGFDDIAHDAHDSNNDIYIRISMSYRFSIGDLSMIDRGYIDDSSMIHRWSIDDLPMIYR